MTTFAGVADRDAIEIEMPWAEREVPRTIYQFVTHAKQTWGQRPAISFQLLSDPAAPAETLTWAALHARVTQAANLFRDLGVGEEDAVAYLLPNCNEAVFTLLGGAVAGIANPINPLLEPEKIASILRQTNAKVLVTLKSFPKSDVAQKAARAVAMAPNVTHVLEVDLLRYLTGLKKFLVPLIRPGNPVGHTAKVLDFNAEMAKRAGGSLDFVDADRDRVAAYFHTGGTTGMPKVAQHLNSGMIYNGWIGKRLLFTEDDVILCPLPLFHVFACHPILMSMIASGAHVVFPTPAGYRGEGVFDNFWKLVERWQVTFMIGVPTAFSALMQRPVNADLKSLKSAFSGSAPLPVELYHRFEKACGVNIIEGYGLTEATCLVSCNPVDGPKKIGSVGIPFPHTDVKILIHTADDGVRECGVDEVGEICVANPGVYAGSTYTESDRNRNLFHYDIYLRTGDLGRMDADGYLWITGRAKDLIIRGGHNIDPAVIEEALLAHDAVASAGAIGQPDAHAGELPVAYVELVSGASVTEEELLEFCRGRISERAAMPKRIEIVDELPKTAVGKIFKPDLRRRAICRVYNAALREAGIAARVADVEEDRKLGLVAMLEKTGEVDEAALREALGHYTRPWAWKDAARDAA
ncbi:MAG: acyl-CoA synthetase [Paracoccaceae bacterium]|jgi:fatty-acyl-CoA synthase|nr:acyl-CoA synthetase [Paracoccaceae bacterium]